MHSIICELCSSVKIFHSLYDPIWYISSLHGVSFPCHNLSFLFQFQNRSLELAASRTLSFCAPKPYWWHNNLIYLKHFVFGNSLTEMETVWQLQIKRITEFVIQHRQI